MITNEIYFFKNQSTIGMSDSLYNVNDGTLILQVDGDVSKLELSIFGNTDLVGDNYVTLKTINASDYSVSNKITSTGIYWIDINGIRKIKLNLSKITGSVNIKAITKRGLTTDLVARAMAANSSGDSNTTECLKYKGHVNSKEDLPTAGQVSGALISPNNSIRAEFANSIISNDATRKEKIENARVINYDYYLGMWFDKVNYAFMLETNYPEIIDAIYFAPTNGYSACVTMYVHINASTSKPCKVSNINMVNYEDGTNTSSNTTMNKPGWVYKDTGWNDLFKALSMFSNIGHNLKFKKNPNVTSYQYNTLELNNFFYNEGYKMLAFDENGNTSFVTITPSDIVENDVYTVGDDYDLVRGNATEQKWEPLAPKSDLYKTYTGYDETKTQILKNINGTLTWVDEV